MGGELFLLFVPMLVTLSCQFAVNVVWVAEDSWTSKTAMQEARYGHGVVVVNRKIYAIGGQTARAQLSQFSCLTNEVPRMSSSQHNYIPEFSSWVVLPLFKLTTDGSFNLQKTQVEKRG